MRIREIRRFLGSFIVFVNTKDDINNLRKNKRFYEYASYRDSKNGLSGVEFKFDYKSKTLKSAKSFIVSLLREDK
jgi:hypothetical protein